MSSANPQLPATTITAPTSVLTTPCSNTKASSLEGWNSLGHSEGAACYACESHPHSKVPSRNMGVPFGTYNRHLNQHFSFVFLNVLRKRQFIVRHCRVHYKACEILRDPNSSTPYNDNQWYPIISKHFQETWDTSHCKPLPCRRDGTGRGFPLNPVPFHGLP